MIDWANFGHGVLHIAMTVYVLTGLLGFVMAYKFYKTVDGRLRIALIEFFIGLGIAVTLRGIWGFLEAVVRFQSNPYVSLLSILIVFITLLRFVLVFDKIEKNKLSK